MKLLIFGDSIARWAFDGQAWGWVERLKTYFLSTYDQYWLWVYNMSVSSNDSRGVLQFIEHDIKKILSITKSEQEELIIMIAIWTNDPRHIWTIGNIVVDEWEFIENMKNIISIGQKYSKKIIFVGWFPIDEIKVNPRYNEEYYFNKDLQHYDDLMRQVSTENSINFISLWDNIQVDKLSDGLHPNAQWHNNIYEIVKAHILNTYYT
jgi:lysophospholipase L1-like esterase